MAVNTKVPEDLKEARIHSLKLGISPQEGKEIFGRILNSAYAQVVVSKQSLLSRMMQDKRGSSTVKKAEMIFISKPMHDRPVLSSVYVTPGNSTEQTITNIWQRTLGIKKVGIHDNFFDLGGHSLLVPVIIADLRVAFPQIRFHMGSLFEKPTVHLLSEMIRTKKRGTLSFTLSRSRGQRRKEKKIKKSETERGEIL
jgi:hypothetical protein